MEHGPREGMRGEPLLSICCCLAATLDCDAWLQCKSAICRLEVRTAVFCPRRLGELQYLSRPRSWRGVLLVLSRPQVSALEPTAGADGASDNSMCPAWIHLQDSPSACRSSAAQGLACTIAACTPAAATSSALVYSARWITPLALPSARRRNPPSMRVVAIATVLLALLSVSHAAKCPYMAGKSSALDALP